MPEEFYTSEDKVLYRLGVSHEHALAALHEAGYSDLGQARDILGKQLAYHAVLLVKIAELKRSLDTTASLILSPNHVHRSDSPEPKKGK